MDNVIANDKEIDLVRLTLSDDWSFYLRVSVWFWIVLIAIFAIFFFIRWNLTGSILGKRYEIDSAELGLGKSKITFRPNMNDKSVAYKIWVELSTRKIGLPIDFDDDVISEIYDSWFNFFSVTRELIKDIPVSKVRASSTKQIINLSIDVLNLGLRPHLTKWQARFRKWYEYKVAQDPNGQFHPQDIQKEFPHYEELVADMKLVNEKLIRYRDRMNELIYC